MKSTESTRSPKSNLTVVDLTSLNRQNVTRLQKFRAGPTYFNNLPAEIRDMIYKLYINDFTGLEKFFDKYYGKLQRSRDPREVRLPVRTKKTSPSILRVSRQTYAEARYVLQQKSITFHHGLLGIGRTIAVSSTIGGRIDKVISPSLLHIISSITVSTKGHPTLAIETLLFSWRGYTALLAQLGQILSKGHKLKDLTIIIDDERLCEHMKRCAETPGVRCDFRDELRVTLDALGQVRDVPKVRFEGGLPEEYTGPLVERMQGHL